MRLVGGCAADLGMLLRFRVMLCAGAMRLGYAPWCSAASVWVWLGICVSRSPGISGRSLATLMVFAARALVVFNELNWLVGQLSFTRTFN